MALAEAGHGVAVIPSAQRADRYALRIQAITYRGQRLRERLTILLDKRRTLAEKTLAMLRCNGTGPKFIKRGRIFYFQSDIDDWMNANGHMTSTAQAKHAAS